MCCIDTLWVQRYDARMSFEDSLRKMYDEEAKRQLPTPEQLKERELMKQVAGALPKLARALQRHGAKHDHTVWELAGDLDKVETYERQIVSLPPKDAQFHKRHTGWLLSGDFIDIERRQYSRLEMFTRDIRLECAWYRSLLLKPNGQLVGAIGTEPTYLKRGERTGRVPDIPEDMCVYPGFVSAQRRWTSQIEVFGTDKLQRARDRYAPGYFASQFEKKIVEMAFRNRVKPQELA